MHREVLRTGLLILLAALGAGCRREQGPVCYPVRGQVLFEGKPIAEANVVFHPLLPGPENSPQPIAFTDSEGRFELTTWAPQDGAPLGEYAVTIELREARLVGEEMVREGRNLLPPAYASREKTPLRYRVQEGENNIPPFVLNRSASTVERLGSLLFAAVRRSVSCLAAAWR